MTIETLLLTIRNRQLKLLEHVMRKKGLVNLIRTRNTEDIISRGKQFYKFVWMNDNTVPNKDGNRLKLI